MTILTPPETNIVHIADRPRDSTPEIRCEQIIYSTTGERPLWVHYDPKVISCIAHLWSPTNAARYMLGAAGFRRCQTLATGELWARPITQRKDA